MAIDRFLEAQQSDYLRALNEIQDGHKNSHWIWYIFPQMKGLGSSYNSNYYGIESKQEAEEYLQHPILSERLRRISNALLMHEGEDIYSIMGHIDAQKLKSSMTLFDAVAPNEVFGWVLDVFFDGKRCLRTLEMLNIK